MALNLGKIARSVLETVAPLAATALGGPATGALVTNLIGKALGTDNEDEIEQTLAAGNPDTLLALKNLDKDLRLEMRRLGIEETRAFLGDRQDARGMAKTLNKIWPQFTIAVALTLMVAGVIYALFWFPIPDGAAEVLYIVLGAVLREWGGSISFFVGTTKSSSEKNAVLAQRNA